MLRRMTALIALALLWPCAAQADLLINFNPAGLSSFPGATVTFNATLTNTGPDTLFLNGAEFNGLGPGLTPDPTPFFTNFPLFLVGGDAATADILNVSIDPAVMPDDYIGSLIVTGGADGNAQDILATQNFLVSVAPEPGTLALLAGLVLSGVGFALRRR